MTVDIDRLLRLTQEKERAAMPRTSQFPSMTDQLLRQKSEIDALRRGLSDALTEIAELRRKVSGDQRDRLKLALDAACAALVIMPVQKSVAVPGLHVGPYHPDVVAAIPVPLWEDLLVAIDYLPDTME